MITVTGSLGYDYILNFSGRFVDRIMPDKIHQISLGFLAEKMSKQLGGTAGNIAYSLKLLGLQPTIVACVGSDGQELLSFFKQNNLAIDYIQVVKSELTGTYFVVTDREDNQIGAFYQGATIRADKLNLPTESDFVVVSPTKPEAMVKYVEECIRNNISFLYDPAFQIEQFSPEQLRRGIEFGQIVIGNDYEIQLIKKKTGWSQAKLAKMAGIMVTTLGSQGAVIEQGGQKIKIKPARAQAVLDPTGAGDAFRGGFLAGFMRGLDLKTCGQMGAVAAVYTVEKYGTVTHSYTRTQFQKRYLENYHAALNLN